MPPRSGSWPTSCPRPGETLQLAGKPSRCRGSPSWPTDLDSPRATSRGPFQCHRRHLYLVSWVDETRGEVMKVFVAGATGALGRQLVPQLVARGHEVVGMTRTASKQDLVRSLGAHPVVADALDPDAVAQAVASAEPEVIVHELTALSGKMSAEGRAAPRTLLRGDHDQPTAYRGDGPSPGRRPRRGGTALRGAEHCGFPIRPHGRAGADRGRSPRSQRCRRRCGRGWRRSSTWSRR